MYLTEARAALRRIWAEAFTAAGLRVDVLDWRPGDYARAAGVMLGDASASFDPDVFSSSRRAAVAEEWSIECSFWPAPAAADAPEAAASAHRMLDVMLNALADNTRLGAEFVTWALPTDATVEASAGDGLPPVMGALTVQIRFQVRRT